jgi:hypothetical protein
MQYECRKEWRYEWRKDLQVRMEMNGGMNETGKR